MISVEHSAGKVAARWGPGFILGLLTLVQAQGEVWHQRGWLNATSYADPFPLLQDVHVGSPEISCLWNRNWSYICPLGAHPIPMIGLWDPSAALYVGYDFQEARATDQSERYIATAYCWKQGTLTNFISLAYLYGGARYGNQVYPRPGEVLASWFNLEIDTALPATEDPNERFQQRRGLYGQRHHRPARCWADEWRELHAGRRLLGDCGRRPNPRRANALDHAQRSTISVSWTSPSIGWTLQRNTNGVGSANWSNVTDPSHILSHFIVAKGVDLVYKVRRQLS